MTVEIEGVELDIELAVLRLKSDLRDDWLRDPIGYADLLQPDAVARHFQLPYQPQGADEVNVPKAGFTLRYSLEQSISDRIAYQAIVDSLEGLDASLASSVYGYRIRPGRAALMFEPKVESWISFNNGVRTRLRDSGGTVLVTDVQNFYESIWHKELLADVERLGRHTLASRLLLNKMLNSWSRYDGAGLPQNRDASSFLANLYLQQTDSDMLAGGYDYYRYMDDIRVVCDDRFAARRALMALIGSLRHRHLNVNASKTHIIDAANTSLLDEHLPGPDADVERFDTALRSRHGVDPQVIAMLHQKAEGLISRRAFGERSFRACLDRLRRIANSPNGQHLSYLAINDGLVEALGDYPWLTDAIVAFLRHSGPTTGQVEKLSRIVMQPETFIYSSQAYQVWQLLAVLGSRSGALRLAAQLQAIAGGDVVRAAGALLYLGACGTDEDRIRIAREISQLPKHRLIRRAAVLATQELSGTYSERYLGALDDDERGLRDFLRSRPEPVYVDNVPRRRLSHLNIDLPDEY